MIADVAGVLAMTVVAVLCACAGLGFAPWAREYDARLRIGAPATARTLWRAAHRAYRRPGFHTRTQQTPDAMPPFARPPVRGRRNAWGAAATGGLAACLLAQQGWGGLAPLLLGMGLIALAWLDQGSGLLPDALTLPLMAAGWCLGALNFWAALGASAVTWVCLAAAAGLYRCVRGRDGFGGGDVKCLSMLAGWLGWPAALVVLWSASILGLLGWVLFPGRRQRARPFGPYLALAACPWILWPEFAEFWLARVAGL